jgi:predicted nucleic acid-binding protein
MNAVDTNVLVYALDASKPVKQAKAQNVLHRLIQAPSQTLLLWQVANELLAYLRKWQLAGRISSDDAEAHFRDALTMFPLRLPTAAIFDHSFDLSSRYHISHWDSMILAACKEAGVTTLYSEDLSAATNYDGIAIVNPFV